MIATWRAEIFLRLTEKDSVECISIDVMLYVVSIYAESEENKFVEVHFCIWLYQGCPTKSSFESIY